MVNLKLAVFVKKMHIVNNFFFLFNSRSKRLSLSLNVCYSHPEKKY